MFKLLRYYYNYRMRNAYIKSPPVRFWIEPTNICNIKCNICPQVSSSFPKRGMMDEKLFQKIVLQLRQLKPKHVTLHLSGEPLVHPKIVQFISDIKKEGITVAFSTNAMLLTKSRIEELIHAGLDDIRIDFAASKKKYEFIRQNANWNKVYDNIVTLFEIKKKQNLFIPRILIINVDVTNNKKENALNLYKLKKLFQEYKNKAEFLNLELHTWSGEFAQDAEKDTFLTKHSLLPNKGTKYYPCPHLFGSFNITWNGDVVPCCRDLQKNYVLGNINDNTVMELWNSKKLVSLREKHRLMEFADIPLCCGCTQILTNYGIIQLSKNTLVKLLFMFFGHSFGLGK